MHEHPRPAEPEKPARAVPPPASLPPPARAAVSGQGHPLPSSVRASMEHSFNEDFSAVRLHDGPSARDGVIGSHANALTVGDHIALGPGMSPNNNRVLAHELAHVVQQRGAASRTDGASERATLEDGATQAASTASVGGFPGRLRASATPSVQFDPLQFGAGRTLVVIDNGVVKVNGATVPATAGTDGRVRYNGREVVLDRSGVMRYRDRYTICKPCNPDHYAAPRWTVRPEAPVPDPMGSFYDPPSRSWVLNRQPEVTTATLTPRDIATPGPVDPALQERVTSAHVAREQYEARVQEAMANGRSRADAEALVRSRMSDATGKGGLGTFETGQTYAMVETEVGEGVRRRTTTGATGGGETPTVAVPAPELRTRFATLNKMLGENFVFNDQTLNHAEVRSIVRTPNADVYYVNRPMCPVCQRYFLMESMAQGRKITVVDPEATRVFTPDRRITEWRGNVVYERTASVTRSAGVSSLEIGDHPSVTHSVRTVPRTTPVPASGAGEGGSAKGAKGATAEAAEGHGLPKATAPSIRPGVVEPEVPGRPGALRTARGAGIRRFGLAAGRILAEGLLTFAMLVFEIIWQLIVIPYLEKLQRKLEERYRQLLQTQIEEYFQNNLAAQVQNRVLKAAEELRLIEDQDAQPYVNTAIRVRFSEAGASGPASSTVGPNRSPNWIS